MGDVQKRRKIRLKHLDWKTVETALATGQPIEAIVNMTDEKGGPLCASVKLNNIRWKDVAPKVPPSYDAE
ncbi:MAG: DUF5990 family protein [Pyrinomonadaceae bacterium]